MNNCRVCIKKTGFLSFHIYFSDCPEQTVAGYDCRHLVYSVGILKKNIKNSDFSGRKIRNYEK